MIYILILDPDDEALCRCISTVYENILRHLIDVEIYHYVESDYKIVATEKVNKLTRQMPTMDQSIVVDLSETKYGLCSYKIACITVDDFIDHILGALKYEKRYFAPLLRLGCAWDD